MVFARFSGPAWCVRLPKAAREPCLLGRAWVQVTEKSCLSCGRRLCQGARVACFFGDKGRFAAEVGDWAGPALRRVDLWAAGQWLTCDDNMAFVGQFRLAVADTATWLRAGHGTALAFPGVSAVAAHRRLVAGTGREEEDDALRRRFRFFDCWGPTTDNVEAFVFREGDRLEVTWQFWREEHLLKHPEHAGTIFTLEIHAAELAGLLEDLVAELGRGGEPPAATQRVLATPSSAPGIGPTLLTKPRNGPSSLT
jgi:hypothetical protein